MFNTLSTPFSLMDSVDIIHLKIGRAPLPTVYGWNGTHPTMGGCKGVGRTLAISWKRYVGYLIKNRCSQVLSYKGHVFAENEAP